MIIVYIKDTGKYQYGKFEIDMDAIDNSRSISQTEIVFPFTGNLPLPYTTATISFDVSHETRIITIKAEREDKPAKSYFLAAGTAEVEKVLWSFFYEDMGELASTRDDNGLSPFWNGILLARYQAWVDLQREPERVIAILQQLTAEQRKTLYPAIDGMRAEDNDKEEN